MFIFLNLPHQFSASCQTEEREREGTRKAQKNTSAAQNSCAMNHRCQTRYELQSGHDVLHYLKLCGRLPNAEIKAFPKFVALVSCQRIFKKCSESIMRQVLHVNEPGLGRDDGSCVMMYHKFQPQHRAYKVLCPPPLIKRRRWRQKRHRRSDVAAK